METSSGDMCPLTMRARLFVYKALSCPGSLGECNFTSNFGLCRLHCLSDCVLSLCKSVCSYFGLLLRPGNSQPYGFHIAESSVSASSRCRNQGRPIICTRRVERLLSSV